jgi:hypothetical protein
MLRVTVRSGLLLARAQSVPAKNVETTPTLLQTARKYRLVNGDEADAAITSGMWDKG